MALIAIWYIYIYIFFQFLVVNQKFFNYNICKADANLPVSKFCPWRGSAVFQHFTRASICYFRVILIHGWLNLVSLHWMCLKPNKGSRVPVLPASCTALRGGGQDGGWPPGHSCWLPPHVQEQEALRRQSQDNNMSSHLICDPLVIKFCVSGGPRAQPHGTKEFVQLFVADRWP